MTEDEKTQRIVAENRYNELVELLRDIKNLLTELVKPKEKEEKKEGE